MNINNEGFNLIKQIKAISQIGLTYSSDDYNLSRYKELENISYKLHLLFTGIPIEELENFYLNKKEYPTPKTDIRAVIFNDQHEILLVKEQTNQKWSLPGGWADIGLSPKETAVNEVAEETGLIVKPKKLLAVLDKKYYPHPSELEYVYKYFIECSIEGGEITKAHDITEVSFFNQNSIPTVSEERVLKSQIDLMFEFHYNPDKETIFD